jgi:hypothetical protein
MRSLLRRFLCASASTAYSVDWRFDVSGLIIKTLGGCAGTGVGAGAGAGVGAGAGAGAGSGVGVGDGAGAGSGAGAGAGAVAGVIPGSSVEGPPREHLKMLTMGVS